MSRRDWTPAEVETLREAYSRGGIRAARKALPHRGDRSIYLRAQRLDLELRPLWTEDEVERLVAQWGLESMRSLVRWTGRRRASIYLKAKTLGLPLGAPPGWEPLEVAARRAGYSPPTLRTILRFACFRVYEGYTPRQGGRWIVRIEEVDQAVARYVRTETLQEAARRHGMCAEKLARICRLAKVKLRRVGTLRKSHVRADTADFDRAVQKLAEHHQATESVREAAARLGIDRNTVVRWIRLRGDDPRTGREDRLPRSYVDELAARYLERPGIRERTRGHRMARAAA